MTEPLYTYEYETDGGFIDYFLAESDRDAEYYMRGYNRAVEHLDTFEQSGHIIIKLTNTLTKEVIYEVKNDTKK